MEMMKTERIKEYVARNPKPDQSVCPELVQYWRKRNGAYEKWYSKTGERKEVHVPYFRPSSNEMSVRNWYEGAYFKADGDMLEIARLELYMSGRGKAGEPKEWDWSSIPASRCFIFKGDPVAYDATGYPLSCGQKTYYNETISRLIYQLSGTINDGTVKRQLLNYLTDNYEAELEKDFYIWHFGNFYKKNWMSRKTSKNSQNILSLELSDFDRSKGDLQMEIFDHYAVIRGIGWSSEESSRVFISDKGKVTICDDTCGEWRVTPATSNLPNGTLTKEMLEQWKPLKWLIPCIRFTESDRYYGLHNCSSRDIIRQIIQLLRHPIVESLAKSGYPEIAKKLVARNEIPNNIRYYFGVKEKKGNLYKVLGINKWLLMKVENCIKNNTNSWRWNTSEALHSIRSLKLVYGRDDISDLSKETIDAVFDGVYAMEISHGTWMWSLFGSGRWGRVDYSAIELTEEQRKKMLRVIKFCTRNPEAAQIFLDTASMKNQMGEAAPDIDVFGFENSNDLMRMHNALVELREQQRRIEQARWDAQRRKELEEQQKMFERSQKKRIEKYEYEDAEYCIRVPHKLEEITIEGSCLHHCVGSYLDRHANGNTNIIFLRHKTCPEMPFYTIEICNGRLIQIHGSHNRWLGNNPEAIPFVYEWLNRLGDVSFDVDMLLNKASGYGRCDDQLDKSYLYRKESVVA